jgi:hypothetical protein
MLQLIHTIDQLSAWVGKAFAWLILVLTLGVSYEVVARYVFRAPTTWAFDFSYINYGALFLMAGAYALSRNGHVRADVLYRLWPARVQAGLDLVLYLLFFFPAVIAFVYGAVQRGQHFQPRRRPGLSAEGAHPADGVFPVPPGHRRALPLRHLPSRGILAGQASRRRGDGDRNLARAGVSA